MANGNPHLLGEITARQPAPLDWPGNLLGWLPALKSRPERRLVSGNDGTEAALHELKLANHAPGCASQPSRSSSILECAWDGPRPRMLRCVVLWTPATGHELSSNP